jgi:hypothetical protein
MTTTGSERIESDVRPATQPAAAEGAGPAGVEEEVAPPGSPSPPAENADDKDADDGEDVRNPELKKLHDEAARYRTSAKAEKERADAAAEALRAARIENAFLRAAVGKVTDTDAAFKLADTTDLTIDDDGNVTDVDDVVAEVVERYPYLRPEVTDDDLIYGEDVPPTQPSGRSTNYKRTSDDGSGNRAVLESKFPALRGRA